MYNKRWYDDNENLKGIIEALGKRQDLDSVALDIIQIMFQKQSDRDDFLEVISKDFIDQRERWYDRYYMFHSAIEMLKFLPSEVAERILRESLSYCDDMGSKADEYENFHRH